MSVNLEGCMCSMQWELGALEAPKHFPEGVKQFQGKLCRESQWEELPDTSRIPASIPTSNSINSNKFF